MKKINIISIVVMIFIFICLYIGFSGRFEDDGVREPIAVEKINWKTVESNQNYYGISVITFYLGGEEKTFLVNEDFLKIIQFFGVNKTKISSKKTNNAVKVYIEFNNKIFFDASSDKHAYNDKKSTFYLDESLRSKLPELFSTMLEH